MSTSGFLDNRLLRFLLAGGFAAASNFASRFIYSLFVDFSTAVVLAFFTGLTVGFVLNKLFVFTASRNSLRQEISWFFLINMLALAQTWGLSVFLVEYLPADLFSFAAAPEAWVEALAHGAGVLFPVFTSYLGHRYLTFRE